MGIKDMALKWFDSLPEKEKLKVVDRFIVLIEEEGMVLVSGRGTLKPTYELPHGPENDIKKRKRENKENKLGKKCHSTAIMEAYRDHLTKILNE